jgi:hypothetical protein
METSMSVDEKPSIPLDVIETIIAFLAAVDDQKLSSVKTCSLTCRSFLHFCRTHIFASLSIDVYAPQPLFPLSPRFQQLFASTPEIVHFVRTLKIGVSHSEYTPESKELFDLADALRTFTRVEHLTITSYRRGIVQDWANVAECLQDAALHLLTLPTIRDLRVSGLAHFPILELTRCTHLRGLCTAFLRDPVLHARSPTVRPRSLVLDECTLEWESAEAMAELIAFAWRDGRPFLDFARLRRFYARRNNMVQETAAVTRQILQRANEVDCVALDCTRS